MSLRTWKLPSMGAQVLKKCLAQRVRALDIGHHSFSLPKKNYDNQRKWKGFMLILHSLSSYL